MQDIFFKNKECHNLIKFKKPLMRGLVKTIARLFQFMYHVCFSLNLKNPHVEAYKLLQKIVFSKDVFT